MAFPNSKPLTEFEMRNFLRAGGLALPPASFQTLEEEVLIPFNNEGKPEESRGRLRANGIVEACWQGRSERFVVEYKAHSTPKALDTVISQAVRYGQSLNLPPLIVVPFLSEEQLRALEAQRRERHRPVRKRRPHRRAVSPLAFRGAQSLQSQPAHQKCVPWQQLAVCTLLSLTPTI